MKGCWQVFGVAALSALSAITLGCSLEPRYRRPVAPVPQQWPSGRAYGARAAYSAAAVRYQAVFRDPNLRSVIAAALANSRDLRAAAANVASARAQYQAARAGFFPRVDANAGALLGAGAAPSATGAVAGPAGAGNVYHLYSIL
jgi:multidrug efflux system outer membrane protein